MPVASIVITMHDRPLLVHRAIRSALRQSEDDIEVIVIDDGSREPLRIDLDDPRLQVIRRDRSGGVCAARNVGLEQARGAWITFLDDDDELLPDMVERSIRAATDSPLARPVAVLSGRKDIDASGAALGTHLPLRLPAGSRYLFEEDVDGDLRAENTLFAPTELLRDVGGWDEAIRSWEHDDLMLRLNAVCSLQGVPVATYLWHRHPGDQRHEDALDSADGMARTIEKHSALFARYPRRHAKYLGTMGVMYLKAGRWRLAVVATTRSILRDPRQSRLWLWWLATLGGPLGLAFFRAARRELQGGRRVRDTTSPVAPGSRAESVSEPDRTA